MTEFLTQTFQEPSQTASGLAHPPGMENTLKLQPRMPWELFPAALSLDTPITKRDFLSLLALGTGIGLTSCTNQETPSPSEELLQRATDILDRLLDSTPKEFITNHGLPLFKAQQEINVAGTIIIDLINPPILTLEKNPQITSQVQGIFNLRKGSLENLAPTYPTSTQKRSIPYPRLLLTDSEFDQTKTTIGEDRVLNDAILISMTYKNDVPIYPGISPHISIQVPASPSVPQETLDLLVNFVLIKELASAAYTAYYIEQTILLMQDNGYDTTIPTASDPVEIISQTMAELFSRQGRLLATADIAAYLITILVFEGQYNYEVHIANQPDVGQYAQEIWQLPQAQNPKQLFQTVTNWVINNQGKANSYPHTGNLNSIP